eukprot:c23760_g1_i2 orf=170-2116(-)
MDTIMARSRKNAQHQAQQLQQQQHHHPPEALPLPPSTFPLQDPDPEASAEKKHRDDDLHFPLLHKASHHQPHNQLLLLHDHHLHHHYSSLPPSRSFGKPSARLCALLALVVIGSFIFLPSLLTSSSFQPRSHHQSTSLAHHHFGNVDNDDFTLGGLLAESSDITQCRSRGLIHRLRSKSPYLPSPYLVSKLREYEALHRRCGPGTKSFNKSASHLERALNDINSKKQEEDGEECRYIVWMAHSGLGNRLISIASAFVYALLTRRVLVLDGKSDLGELLCEPFPGEVSWLLPSDFAPLARLTLNESSPHRFGLQLKQGTILPSVRDPPVEDRRSLIPSSSFTSHPSSLFSYLHLTHGYDFYDKLFFCHTEQASLHQIPWLFLSTNLYFVPSLYLYLPEFRQELNRLFPEPESVFHHVSRYLFFPTNPVWSWILRFYDAYLAKSSQIVGVQIRSFVYPPVAQPHVTKQILTCAVENNLLPKTLKEDETEPPRFARNSTAVLVTSLLPDYSEQIMEVYADYPTETGEVVSVYQPSHEVHQNTEAHGHNMKAWAEMCLLSFSTKLITSPMSTFGYVAQGMAGIRPWLLASVEDGVVPSPACSQALSMDPCFHAPPYFDCDGDKGDDTTKVLPYVKHCEDVEWGLKVFPNTNS